MRISEPVYESDSNKKVEWTEVWSVVTFTLFTEFGFWFLTIPTTKNVYNGKWFTWKCK